MSGDRNFCPGRFAGEVAIVHGVELGLVRQEISRPDRMEETKRRARACRFCFGLGRPEPPGGRPPTLLPILTSMGFPNRPQSSGECSAGPARETQYVYDCRRALVNTRGALARACAAA